jgi:hypothetical protein
MLPKTKSITNKRSILKRIDIFGHQIALNFERNGNKHVTTIGGIASVGIAMALFGYFINLYVLLMNHNPTQISQF